MARQIKRDITIEGDNYTFDGDLQITRFHDGQAALIMHDNEGGIDRLSVSLAYYGRVAPPRHTFLEDNGSTRGVADALEKLHIVKRVELVEYGQFDLRAWLVEINERAFA